MLLNCYLLKQLIILFSLTVGLLSGVGVAIGTLSDLAYQINNYNLPLIVALRIFLLKIPEYVAYGLPIATLLTTLIVYGRLNSDRELIALRSVGISVYRMILPGIFFSVFISIITLVINEAIVPQANYQVTLLQEPFVPETKFSLQKKDIFHPEYELNRKGNKQLKILYYARNFDGKHLKNIIILSWKDSQLNRIITARYADCNSQINRWHIQKGIIENLSNDKLDSSRISFDNYYLALPKTFFQIVAKERDPYAMSLIQAKEYLKLILDSNNLKKIRLFQVRIQQKIAFPCICTIFATIGSSIGATFTNINRSQSFGFCVAIAFGYYLLGLTIGSLGIAGLISPIIAAWLPNAIAFGFGFWLLKKANYSI